MSSSSSAPAYRPLAAAELDQLISDVARRHNFLLDRDDPVLVTVTLNELVLSNAAAQVAEAVQAARIEISAAAAQQTAAAKMVASQLITAAAQYADEQFRLAANSAAEEIKTGLLKQFCDHPLCVDTEKVTRAASLVRCAAALTYLAATITALIAVIFPLALASPSGPVICTPPATQPERQRELGAVGADIRNGIGVPAFRHL